MRRAVAKGAIAASLVGLAALVAGVYVDAARTAYAYLAAWLFAESVAVGALVLLMVGHAAKASWMIVTRRLTEAVVDALPIVALLFVPIALSLPLVYPWVERPADHKRLWLSPGFFVARTAIYFVVFCAVGVLLRAWSKANDERPSSALVRRMRRLSGGGLPLVGLALSWASFDQSMSLQPEWHSTMFGFYFFAGSFVGAIALVAVMMRLTGARAAKADHAQALGRVLFAMIVFWAYVSFGQLLVYWIGDVPGEVSWFLARSRGGWGAVTWLIVCGHFVVPFCGLLNRRCKRRSGYLAAVGAWVLLMHFVDVYWQVLPVHDAGGFRPHWLDLGAVLFVGGVCCAWIVRRYASARAIPRHDPQLVQGLEYEAAL